MQAQLAVGVQTRTVWPSLSGVFCPLWAEQLQLCHQKLQEIQWFRLYCLWMRLLHHRVKVLQKVPGRLPEVLQRSLHRMHAPFQTKRRSLCHWWLYEARKPFLQFLQIGLLVGERYLYVQELLWLAEWLLPDLQQRLQLSEWKMRKTTGKVCLLRLIMILYHILVIVFETKNKSLLISLIHGNMHQESSNHQILPLWDASMINLWWRGHTCGIWFKVQVVNSTFF